jgi:hypothetical protein
MFPGKSRLTIPGGKLLSGEPAVEQGILLAGDERNPLGLLPFVDSIGLSKNTLEGFGGQYADQLIIIKRTNCSLSSRVVLLG